MSVPIPESGRMSAQTLHLADKLDIAPPALRELFAAFQQDTGQAPSSSVAAAGASAVASSAAPRSFSVADALFMLHVARKEAVDQSLEVAVDHMKGKLEQQQQLNAMVQSWSARVEEGNGDRVRLTEAEVELLRATGYALTTDPNDAKSPIHQADINSASHDTAYFVRAGKLDDAKKSITDHVSNLSATNEIAMLSVQRLMNQANEASQAASALLKSGHDVAMSIIRNIA